MRTRTVHILPPEAEAEYLDLFDQAEAEFLKAEEGPVRASTAGAAQERGKKLLAKAEKVRAGAWEQATRVVLTELPGDRRDEIIEDNPPRTVAGGASARAVELDEMVGFDRRAVKREQVFAMLVEPKLSREDFEAWFAGLGVYARDQIDAAIGELASEPSLPKFSIASAVARMTSTD